jgi:hypothetical protein
MTKKDEEMLCPLCSKPNACAIANKGSEQKSDQQDCWCMRVNISDEVLAKVPADKKAKACICQSCLKSF